MFLFDCKLYGANTEKSNLILMKKKLATHRHAKILILSDTEVFMSYELLFEMNTEPFGGSR